MESALTFKLGLSFLILSISNTKKSNLPWHFFRILRVTDSKYRESLDRFEKSKTLKLCLKNGFLVALFKNVIPIFQELNAFEKFAKNENALFYLIKYAKNIRKIDEVLGNRIETIYNFRTRDQLSIKASPFVYVTIGSFNFFKYYKGLCRLSKIFVFKLQWKL